MDRIDAMRTFTAVVAEGSFTRAANRLDMSPQLVSKYISQLEEHLGVRLLNRTTRKVHLTEAGIRYSVRVQQLLDDIDDLEAQVGRLQKEARGDLRITAPVSFVVQHLAPLICEFQRIHPEVNIDLQLNDRKVDIVDEGFDIALRVGRLKSSSLIAKQLASVRLVACAAPEYLQRHGTPKHPNELKNHRYLRYSYLEEASFGTENFFRSHGTGELLCNNGDVLAMAAIEGAGIVVQPTFICGRAIADGRLTMILADYEPEPMGLYAVYAHRKLLASKVRSFIDFADGYFGSPPYWDAF